MLLIFFVNLRFNHNDSRIVSYIFTQQLQYTKPYGNTRTYGILKGHNTVEKYCLTMCVYTEVPYPLPKGPFFTYNDPIMTRRGCIRAGAWECGGVQILISTHTNIKRSYQLNFLWIYLIICLIYNVNKLRKAQFHAYILSYFIFLGVGTHLVSSLTMHVYLMICDIHV